MGAQDTFIGGDVNIELKLEGGNGKFQGLDGLVWYGLCGPECRGGSENLVTYENTLATVSEGFRLRGDEYFGEL